MLLGYALEVLQTYGIPNFRFSLPGEHCGMSLVTGTFEFCFQRFTQHINK